MEDKIIYKKKLKDLSLEEFKKWKDDNCPKALCFKCVFKSVVCQGATKTCWVNNKEIFNDEFLNQEVEIKDNIKIDCLNDKERNYLNSVIGFYRKKVLTITKRSATYNREYIEIVILLDDNSKFAMNLCPFEKDTMYKNMELYKEYTLKELGL